MRNKIKIKFLLLTTSLMLVSCFGPDDQLLTENEWVERSKTMEELDPTYRSYYTFSIKKTENGEEIKTVVNKSTGYSRKGDWFLQYDRLRIFWDNGDGDQTFDWDGGVFKLTKPKVRGVELRRR